MHGFCGRRGARLEPRLVHGTFLRWQERRVERPSAQRRREQRHAACSTAGRRETRQGTGRDEAIRRGDAGGIERPADGRIAGTQAPRCSSTRTCRNRRCRRDRPEHLVGARRCRGRTSLRDTVRNEREGEDDVQPVIQIEDSLRRPVGHQHRIPPWRQQERCEECCRQPESVCGSVTGVSPGNAEAEEREQRAPTSATGIRVAASETTINAGSAQRERAIAETSNGATR